MPGTRLVARQNRQNVTAGRDFDAVPVRLHGLYLAHRITTAGNVDQDHLAAILVFQGVEHTLGRGREIGGFQRHIFFRDDRRAGPFKRLLECRNAVLAKA